MKDNAEKHIDKIVGKIIKDSKIESPSQDFTIKIMSKVEVISSNEVTTYRPLISKHFFIGFIIFVTVFSGFVVSVNTSETESWFSMINFRALSNNIVTKTLTSIKIPSTVLYSIVFFGVMLFIQIPLLKYYFNKRLKL